MHRVDLADQLHACGLRLVAHALTMERLLPPAEAAPYTEQLDAWFDGGPQGSARTVAPPPRGKPGTTQRVSGGSKLSRKTTGAPPAGKRQR